MSNPIGIIGVGTIGRGWAWHCLARGRSVILHDRNAGHVEEFRRTLPRAWASLKSFGLIEPDASPDRWCAVSEPEDVAAQSQFIQESIAENLAEKIRLFQRIEGQLSPQAIVASSTSSLRMSDMQPQLRRPAQFIVGHPLNSPHLLPLVEVVPGERTSEETVERTVTTYSALGRVVIRLKKEVVGHITARLASAVFREVLSILDDGAATVEQIDYAVRDGLARRWAATGPFLTFHLAAGDQGIRGYLEHLGPAHETMWRKLARLKRIEPSLIDEVEQGILDYVHGRSIEALVGERDHKILSIAKLLDETPHSPG